MDSACRSWSRVLLSSALLVVLASPAAPARAQVNRSDPVLTAGSWHGRPVVAGQALVQFAPGTPQAAQRQAAAALGCEHRLSVSDTLAQVALPAGADLDSFLARWRAVPGVLFAQPNAIHLPVDVPSDPKWPQQWHLPKVHADLAWDSYQGDPAAVVAIIDSGADVDHADLDGQLAWGFDFFANDADFDDQSGHGTHCSGIAAAETDNGLGIAGVAPGCRLAAYRCGDGSFPSSALVGAINHARSQGALVLSMSWGSNWSDPAIKAALQAARDAGCVLLAAAGNDANSIPFYPAAHDFVIAVAASTTSDTKASFSNYGSWVDLAAPGQSIYSTWKSGGYTYSSGTSMACPLVAGMAGLLYARLGSVRSAAHAGAVRAALEVSAVPVGNWVVHGRADLAAALDALASPTAPHVAAVTPAEVPVFGGTLLSVTGDGFIGASGLAVDGHPVAAFSIVDEGTLQLLAPPGSALGPGALVVAGPAGASNAAGLQWVETQPPQLEVPASLAAGSSIAWRYGGGAGDAFFLLASLDTDTFLHAGQPVLLHMLVLLSGTLDGAGLGSVSATLPHGTAGITFHSQLVTSGGGLLVSGIATTTITP